MKSSERYRFPRTNVQQYEQQQAEEYFKYNAIGPSHPQDCFYSVQVLFKENTDTASCCFHSYTIETILCNIFAITNDMDSFSPD